MKLGKSNIEIERDKPSLRIKTVNNNIHSFNSSQSADNIHVSLSLKNCICFGFGCNSTNVSKIYVDTETFGRIELWLCSSCIQKFQQ